MQRLEVSGAVRLIYGSLGVKRLRKCLHRRSMWHLLQRSPVWVPAEIPAIETKIFLKIPWNFYNRIVEFTANVVSLFLLLFKLVFLLMLNSLGSWLGVPQNSSEFSVFPVKQNNVVMLFGNMHVTEDGFYNLRKNGLLLWDKSHIFKIFYYEEYVPITF